LPISNATGHFKHEIKGQIQNFFSFAIKNYSISYEDDKKRLKSITKIKGLFLKNDLLGNQVNNDLFSKFFANIYSQQEEFLAQVRTHKKQPTIQKTLHCVKFPLLLTQKRIVKNQNGIFETIPYGFCVKS
jgi:hypothetical protein